MAVVFEMQGGGMRPTIAATALTICVGLLATQSSAQVPQFRSGNDLYAACATSASGPLASCYSYLTGVADLVSFYQRRLPRNLWQSLSPICMPAGVTEDELRAAVLKHLVKRPIDRRMPAAELVNAAFRAAWLCTR